MPAPDGGKRWSDSQLAVLARICARHHREGGARKNAITEAASYLGRSRASVSGAIDYHRLWSVAVSHG